MKVFFSVFFSLALSCSAWAQTSPNLSISLVPSAAVLIPQGNGTTVDNGYFQLSAPYFTVNGLQINWSGAGSLVVSAITLTTPGTVSGINVACGLAGDDLNAMFPANVDSSAEVMIQSGQPVTSTAFGCSNVIIPEPMPSNINVPVNVEIYGVILDANGNPTDTATATTTLTLQ